MAVETMPRAASRSALERAIDLSRINWEFTAYVLIVALSVVAHLWGLDRMAMHHDESIHAWSSWRFYTGAGSFTCWSGIAAEGQTVTPRISPTYCYDPVYHGPSLYVLTLIAYFLFGDGDAQARLPMAVAGIAMVASCWWLRPYLGRRGALVAAVLLGFAPSLLYYTRFARHDGLMLLWELWMVIGIFRWLDSGRPAWLYLTSVGIAMAIATHELYYILFFIFGVFVLMRLLSESRFARYLSIGLLAVIGLSLVLMVVNPPLPIGTGLYLGEKAFLVASALILAWLCQRLWDPTPLLLSRLRQTWEEQRSSVWIALAILGGLYVTLYTTFFAYPRGAIDGLYAGLAYWLGSQQDYARGDQPWYYYVMQLPIYEPLSVVAGLGMLVFLVVEAARRGFLTHPLAIAPRPAPQAPAGEQAPAPEGGATGDSLGEADLRVAQPAVRLSLDGPAGPEGAADDSAAPATAAAPATVALARPPLPPLELFPLLLVFWFFTAIIIFSWAGEKMPWLLVHMSLPGNLLAAWIIGRLLRQAGRREDVDPAADGAAARPSPWPVALIPIATVLLLVAVGVGMWRISLPGDGQAAQSGLLQGLVPLLIAGGLLYALLTIAQQIGARTTLAIVGVTFAAILGAYMTRATWKVVYEHPDVPIEPLVYTQTAPDVPRYVADIRELAINLTRGQRSATDVAGGLSMPIILDSGNATGDGSLAWPLQWYLRDFQRLNWKRGSELRDNPSRQALEVQMPDGSTALAPVVMLYKPHVSDQLRNVLSESYVQPYGPTGMFNWWFPEGNKCTPGSAGYKRFYYSTLTPVEELTRGAGEGGGGGGCGRDISAELKGPLAPILWPFQRENWATMAKYMLFRELPYPLTPGGREMEVWVRSDLAGSFGQAAASESAALRLVADQSFALPGGSGPTGVAIDSRGNVYVADTARHQIHVFDQAGTLIRSFGGLGSGNLQFYEPRGLAVDAQDNLYIADTWNARIVKLDPAGRFLGSWGTADRELPEGRRATITDGTQAGNAAAPLGLFGPRGLAIDAQGRVYIADTGNKRIVVTDGEGNYLFQWGYFGAEPGAFNEPTALGIDAQGNVYVADTWNSRVQVFPPEGGQISPIPLVTWRVSGWRPNTYEDPSLTVSPDGRVFASVPLQNLVLAANLRGDVLLRWGGPGADLASLAAPSGLAVGGDGAVYVVDRTSGRVLRFTLPNVQAGP